MIYVATFPVNLLLLLCLRDPTFKVSSHISFDHCFMRIMSYACYATWWIRKCLAITVNVSVLPTWSWRKKSCVLMGTYGQYSPSFSHCWNWQSHMFICYCELIPLLHRQCGSCGQWESVRRNSFYANFPRVSTWVTCNSSFSQWLVSDSPVLAL